MIASVKSFYRIIASVALMGLATNFLAQNIVPNPSFEVYTICPFTYGTGGPLQAEPWESATDGTVDYFNECANPSVIGVPDNLFGYESAFEGVAYTGGYHKVWNQEYREYLMAPLIMTADAGFRYNVRFWISLADESCATSQAAAYFSVDPPPSNTSDALNVIPQVKADLGFIDESSGWTLISGCFVALGGEKWITIGNFSDNANTPIIPSCTHPTPFSYYYVDSVSVIKGDAAEIIDFDLGEPVTACESYEINAEIPDALYYWEDGSHGPTLTVSETGTYSVTITINCEIGYDSIEVTILTPHSVELGDDAILLCEGESLDISLDPDFGDYTWQDGSTDPEYSITTSGLYEVTLNDGCQETTDAIQVTVIAPPVPFTLGPDAFFCTNTEIEYDFDPELGEFLWQDNSTSPHYYIFQEGTYSLTISNACGEVSDEIIIDEISPPAFTLGPNDLGLCEGSNYSIVLDPGLGDFVWQDGSDLNSFLITSEGSYSVTVSNECGVTSEEIDVHIVSSPTVSLGEDLFLCPGQLPVVLNAGNPGDGITYLWQDGSADMQFNATIGGTYSVTVSNSCFSVFDEVQIFVEDESPQVQLPQDQLLCEGQTFLLSSNGIAGEYLWQDGSVSNEFIVSAPGTYSLTVSNECGSGIDTVVIDYRQDLLPPDLGADVSLCPGEEYIFYANIPGVNYTWQNGSTADSLIVNSAGTYWLQIADQCSVASDTINVAVNDNPPVVDLPTSLALCNNAFLTLDANVSGVSYLWNDGSQGPTIIVGSPGTYSITVSNTCGSDVDTVDIIDAGPAPFVDLGNDIDICNGDVVSLSPVFSDVVTWLWQDGSTGQTYNITQAGSISVEVSNNCGDFADSLIVSALPDIPPIDLGADTSLCPGESFDLSIDPNGVNILWSDGSTLPDLQVASPGLIYATITNQCGSASDSIVVDALAGIPPLDLGIDQSLCPGEVITLSPGIANVNYLWGNGSTSNTYNATTAGEISLTISNECGTNSDTIMVVENLDGPQVNLGQDILACIGDVITLSSDISGVDYLWQDGSTLPDLTTTTSGTFILEVSNSCGQDKDTIVVNIDGSVPTPNLGPDTLLCEGATLQLNSQADAITSIQWHNGSSQPVFNVTAPGEFILNESNHCGNVSDTINVTFLSPPPIVSLGPDQILCPGESVTLTAPATTATITWQDGSHAITYFADQSQVYSLTLSNDCGTTGDDFELTIDQRTPLIDLQDKYPWCPENVFSLSVAQPFAAEYLWNDGSILPTLQITEPGLYSVMVLTDCKTVEHDLEVFESDTCIIKNDFYIPNVFTPNSDDRNDFFEVVFGPELDVTSVSCSIYDRWGNLVYGTNTEPIRWDGSFYNKQMNQAVYTYVIDITYLERGVERTQVLAGDITLIR